MKHDNKIIQLDTPQSTRLVKRLALTAFCGVRYVAGTLSQLPVVATHTAHDICDAWRETALPKH